MLAETVFLDRDGVLNRRAPAGDYITSADELEMLDGAVEAVRILNEQRMLVLVVTNQRGVALGRMTSADLRRVHAELLSQLAAGGAHLDGIYHCPHEEGSCTCRKPETGLFLQAQRDHPEIEFVRSVVIGDSPSDVTAARRIGARGILIADAPLPDCEHAATLLEAAKRIVADQAANARARASARPSGVPTSITDSLSR